MLYVTIRIDSDAHAIRLAQLPACSATCCTAIRGHSWPIYLEWKHEIFHADLMIFKNG